MSKKNEQPHDNPQSAPEADITLGLFDQEPVSMLELSYLVNSILDYYQDEEAADGEEWKKEAGVSKRNIPQEVDNEVKKAFISQLRKFQDDE